MKTNILICFLVSICAFVASLPTTTTEGPIKAQARNKIKSQNISQYDPVCDTIVYSCKRKLPFGSDLLTGTTADTTRPCVKYCVKYVLCNSGEHKIRGKPNECIELNEEIVREEFEKSKSENISEHRTVMPVSLVDFPCQPGFYPDHRGKCIEPF